jgi:hypothetical protein
MPRKPPKRSQEGEEAEPTNASKIHLPVEFTGQQPGEEGVETFEKDDRSASLTMVGGGTYDQGSSTNRGFVLSQLAV